jgi:hypothetical protein
MIFGHWLAGLGLIPPSNDDPDCLSLRSNPASNASAYLKIIFLSLSALDEMAVAHKVTSESTATIESLSHYGTIAVLISVDRFISFSKTRLSS